MVRYIHLRRWLRRTLTTNGFLFCILFLLAASGCVKKKLVSDLIVKNTRIPLFIEIPRNTHTFDNLSPLAYEALHKHFTRVGYNLVDRPECGHTLRVIIKRLEPQCKLVSPNIILLHYSARLELDCMLLDFNHTMVARKTFFFSSLISKPRNPIINSDFIDFEYRRLFERSIPKIEHFFRPHLIDAFK